MPRNRPPDRRRSETHTIFYDGHRYEVSIGYALDGKAIEVFADGPKIGSQVEHLIDDACVWASKLLQWGEDPTELPSSLGRLPSDNTPEPPASVLGAIADLVSIYPRIAKWPLKDPKN